MYMIPLLKKYKKLSCDVDKRQNLGRNIFYAPMMHIS